MWFFFIILYKLHKVHKEKGVDEKKGGKIQAVPTSTLTRLISWLSKNSDQAVIWKRHPPDKSAGKAFQFTCSDQKFQANL